MGRTSSAGLGCLTWEALSLLTPPRPPPAPASFPPLPDPDLGHPPPRLSPPWGRNGAPWATQARRSPAPGFPGSPGRGGLGGKAQPGGELGSRTGNWKGKGVGGLRSSLPPTRPLLPIPSRAGTHSRQGLGAVSGWGEQGPLCVSLGGGGSEGGLICRSNTPTLSCGLRLRLCYFTGLRPTPGGGRKTPRLTAVCARLEGLKPPSPDGKWGQESALHACPFSEAMASGLTPGTQRVQHTRLPAQPGLGPQRC